MRSVLEIIFLWWIGNREEGNRKQVIENREMETDINEIG